MRTPQVSVIMAAFNHAQYIDKAIASALAQTWQDFELIVVNDGSTDATGQIVSQFRDRVRYVYQQNRGQGGARNRGIAEAHGEFICFLDDDDLWEPEYLATVMSVFQQKPETDALHTGFQIIDSEGQMLPQRGGRVVQPDQMYDALIGGGWFPPLVVTVRKACLDEVGPLDETLHGHDDWDLWLRIARNHVFRGIPEALARYRTHEGGLSANFEHMLQDQKRCIVKHFGPEEGDPTSWPPNRRRAFGIAYRTAGVAFMQSGDTNRAHLPLSRAFEIDPDLLNRLDTFYELACGDQPRGYRGQAGLLDIERNGAVMLRILGALFASAGAPAQVFRGAAYGNAYLALGMLSDQAGHRSAARRYLVQAVKANPRLLCSWSVDRRFLKLSGSEWLVDGVRALRGENRRSI